MIYIAIFVMGTAIADTRERLVVSRILCCEILRESKYRWH